MFAVTDESGTVLERYQYDPYGNPTVLSPGGAVLAASAIGQEFLYTGQRLDEEFELYYYKNRYYSAEQGRFVSRDPAGYTGTGSLYVGLLNPVNSADPSGMYALLFAGNITAAERAAIGATFFHVQNRINTMISRINNFLTAAATRIPPCCEFKIDVLDALTTIRKRFMKLKNKLDGSTPLTIEKKDIGAGIEAQLVRRPLQPRAVRYNTNPASSFFNETPSARMETTFHELLHDSGVPNDSGDPWHDNAHNLDDWIHDPGGFSVANMTGHIMSNTGSANCGPGPLNWTVLP